MTIAFQYAQDLLGQAIQAVDDSFSDTNCAIEQPVLVAAFMSMMGSTYNALIISDAIDRLIEVVEKRREAPPTAH